MIDDEKKITRREAVSETISETAGIVLGPIIHLIPKKSEDEISTEPAVENTVPREKRQRPSK